MVAGLGGDPGSPRNPVWQPATGAPKHVNSVRGSMDEPRQAEESPRRAPPDPPRLGSAAWMRRSLPLGIVAALCAVVIVASTVTTNPARWPTEKRFLIWIVLLLVSFAGWGTLAARAFRAESMRGFVRVGLGIAALVAVTGFLLAAHVLSFPVLASLIVVGATVELWRLFEAAPRLGRTARQHLTALADPDRLPLGELAYLVAAAVVLAVAVLRVIGSAKAALSWWNADDSPAYWAFIRELTQRGSFDQGFSFRRMVAFGGQTVLQAITCLGLPVKSANVFDIGICPLVMVGILLQVGRGRWLAIAAGLLVAFLPTSALNSASNFSGSLLLVVVYFTLRLAADESPRRGGALAGMAAAALCTLRHSFIPACGALLAAAALAHFAEPGGKTRRERLAFVVAAAIGFAITIAPWSLASLIASHTPLFPLIKGTYRGGGVDLGAEGAKWLGGLKGIFDDPAPAPQLLVVFVAILALGARLSRAALVPLALGTLACTLLLAKAAPLNPGDDVRYLAAPWIGLLVAFYCEALTGPGGPETAAREALPVATVAIALVAFQLAPALSPGLTAVFENDGLRVSWPGWETEKASRAAALSLQAAIPPGRKVLAGNDEVYHYDFGRNKLLLIDLPNVASPFPFPAEKATPEEYEKTIAELRRRGIDYLLFSNPDASHAMYSGPRWASFRNDGYRTHELLVPRFLAWAGFVKYVIAHRHVAATLGIDGVAELGVSK